MEGDNRPVGYERSHHPKPSVPGIWPVDLIEIYHARQMRDHIIGQLRRLRQANVQVPLDELEKRREIRGYYEALLLTLVELLDGLGDEVHPLDN